jgi:GNAT superfamily N-acetyltransferase
MNLPDGFHGVPPGKLAMVVTHLEMTTPALLRGATLSDGLTFEPLPRDPEIYRDVFRRVGQNWLWFGRLVMDDLQLCSIIEHDDVGLWTIAKDTRPEAILELDFRTPGQCELAYFGLSSELIGNGAGAYLMDRAIETVWSRDITRLHLHTCSIDSPQALGFYVRSGFTPVRRDVEIADDPRALGIYPKDTAPQIPML